MCVSFISKSVQLSWSWSCLTTFASVLVFGATTCSSQFDVPILVCSLLLPFSLVFLCPENHPSDCQKHLLDIQVVFSTRFEQLDAHLVCKPLGIFSQYHFTRRVVILVPDKDSIDQITVLVDLMEPSLYVGKGLSLRDIIDDNDTVGPSIIPVEDVKSLVLL